MGFVLIKYRDIKLLVDDSIEMSAITANLKEINELNDHFKAMCRDLLNAGPDDAALYDEKKAALVKKIGFEIIGAPFTMHDAELFALDRHIDYKTFEIPCRPAVITFNLPQDLKTKVVKEANANRISLQAFMIEMIKKNL